MLVPPILVQARACSLQVASSLPSWATPQHVVKLSYCLESKFVNEWLPSTAPVVRTSQECAGTCALPSARTPPPPPPIFVLCAIGTSVLLH